MNNPVRLGHHIEFTQGFPFYDMVTTFMVALTGSYSIFDKNNRMKWLEHDYMAIDGMLGKGQHYYPHDLYMLAQNKQIDQTKYIKSCCCMLVNIAYAAVADKSDKSSEFEFFRHIRNAGSHGNKFYFEKGAPSSPVSWRGITIDHKLKGKSNPLYGRECFGTFIGIPDMLHLLKDIEIKIISIVKDRQLHSV